MKGFGIKCINFNKIVGFEMRNQNPSENFTVFIKAVVFRNVGLYCIIQLKEQFEFYFDQNCPPWIQNGPWYNTKICSNVCSSSLENLFTTARQNRYALMCSINSYEKLHVMLSDSVSSGGVITIPYGSATDSLKSLCGTLNFIKIWLQPFEINTFGVVINVKINKLVV